MEQLQNTDGNEMEHRKRAKRVMITLFGICMSIFVTCAGIAVFLNVSFRRKISYDPQLHDIIEILFFICIFFAVSGFCLLPVLLRVPDQDQENETR